MATTKSPSRLSEDEFRLLAFMRAYADHSGQRLEPSWIQQQLEFSLEQLRTAARSLVARRLVEFFEWRPDDPSMCPQEILDGLIPMDLKMTTEGWDYLRR